MFIDDVFKELDNTTRIPIVSQNNEDLAMVVDNPLLKGKQIAFEDLRGMHPLSPPKEIPKVSLQNAKQKEVTREDNDDYYFFNIITHIS